MVGKTSPCASKRNTHQRTERESDETVGMKDIKIRFRVRFCSVCKRVLKRIERSEACFSLMFPVIDWVYLHI